MFEALFKEHPRPWSVSFSENWKRPGFDWSKKASPRVVDALGHGVFIPRQYVDHPGCEDPMAEAVCILMVEAANASTL